MRSDACLWPRQIVILLNTLAVMFATPNPDEGHVKTSTEETFALIDVITSARFWLAHFHL